MYKKPIIFSLLFTVTLCLPMAGQSQETPKLHRFEGQHGAYLAERVIAGISSPFAIEILPDGSALVSQRDKGLLTRVNFDSGEKTDISGTPDMHVFGDAGLADIELHPEYATNGWIYISYSEGEEINHTVVLDRLKLDGNAVSERERVFTADAGSEAQYHQGGRIQFHQGFVYLGIGDRQHRERAQDLSNHIGAIVRLHDDGRIPEDNPFVGVEDKGNPPRPEIWSYGHRNPQGLFVHPDSGELWENEHGPRGGDELNRIEKGANYGWPEISFGFEYDGGPIGKGITSADDMRQPTWVYVPSIAPSDLVIYQGDAFPEWKGSFLIGSLALVHLNRLTLRDGMVVNEERLANALLGRIRSIAVDAAGFIYLGSDSGEIWRLKPDR
jgi:glucose/arabinose dehydrogenase